MASVVESVMLSHLNRDIKNALTDVGAIIEKKDCPFDYPGIIKTQLHVNGLGGRLIKSDDESIEVDNNNSNYFGLKANACAKLKDKLGELTTDNTIQEALNKIFITPPNFELKYDEENKKYFLQSLSLDNKSSKDIDLSDILKLTGELNGNFLKISIGNQNYIDIDLSALVSIINTEQIADGAITSNKIADGAITDKKIVDNSITSNKIVDGAITSNKIADGAITGNQFADNTITTEKISNNSITKEKIANKTIGTTQIADGAITDELLDNNSITEEKIADNSITTNKIANGAIGSEKINKEAILSADEASKIIESIFNLNKSKKNE